MTSEPSKRLTHLDFYGLLRGKKPAGLGAPGTNASVAEKRESIWEHYEWMYKLRLGIDHRAIVAEKKVPSKHATVYSIKQFAASDVKTGQDTFLDMFQNIRHQSFVPTHEIFWTDNICFVVLEYMPCSLYEVRANDHLTEPRLAAIVGQASAPCLIGVPSLTSLSHRSSTVFLTWNSGDWNTAL
jgi:hypothetical protein